jgi:fructuronate reductase
MRFCAGRDDAGDTLPLDDPLSERLRAAAATPGDAIRAVHAMLAVDEVFDATARADAELARSIARVLGALRQTGARAAIGRQGECLALSSPPLRD